jgi:hypothetical protein
MLDRWFRAARCAALVLVLAAAPAVADESFTVADVHVDVTAGNALAAKDLAQSEGQAKAFNTLMGRIAAGKAPHVTSAQITDLVVGFEVANERTSSVRYVADYTFHFNPAAIRRLLESSSIAYVEAPAKPVVVLPILTSGNRSELWDDPNPWRDAWAARAGNQGALPLIVPVGDLADVAAIDAPKAIAGDRAALKAIAVRYQNDDVVVVQGKITDGEPRRMEIRAARYTSDGGAAPQTTVLAATGKPGEAEADLLARAVTDTIAGLGQSRKAANTVDVNNSGTLDATLASSSFGDWVAVRNRLREIPVVRGTDLVSFDRSQIHVAIRYVGDRSQLRAALGDHGLDLTGADPDWTLALRAEAAAPKLEAPASVQPAAPAAAKPDDAGPDGNGLDALRKADE